MDGKPASKRGLPHNEKCVFCNLTEEDTQHLFIGCVVVNIIWNSVLKWAGFDQVVQISSQNLRTWWKQALKNMQNAGKKKLNSIIMLVSWLIWRERNNRVFKNSYKPIPQLIDQIQSEARMWSIASKGRFIL
jgi:hypothetical protein